MRALLGSPVVGLDCRRFRAVGGANKPAAPVRLPSEAATRTPDEEPRADPARPPPRERDAEARQREAANREEHRLLREFRESGDPRAFDELVRRTESRVRSVALTILRDPAEAEDAAQDAFLRAFRSADSYRGEGPVGAWLCRIGVRCAHDALRRAGRRRRLVEAATPSAGPEDAAGSSPGMDRRAELESALRRLPSAEREALVLKEVAGMTYAEIARSCRVPLGTAQSRIHRARQRLAEALAPRPER